ncbi:MAG: pyruvate kinase [Anaerolineae bacterium]|nr:pyruvate kinase [Anaerolineae bacterium]
MVKKFDKKRTKIVCTIGPASSNEVTIRAMIRAGMDVARINFSHGDHEFHRKNIETVRRLAEEEGAVVAVMADLQGPKIRLGKIANEPALIKEGDHLTLTTRADADGTDMIFPLPHPEFVKDVRPGNTVLVDDGTLEFKVISRQANDLVCEVVVGGELLSRKGVSAPDAKLTLSAITDKDREDAKFALDMKLDYIAMSFVRSAKDIDQLRYLCSFHGYNDVAIVSKIEKREAIDAFDEILAATDAVMVARGDLGVETPAEEVPIHQKMIIRKCNEVGKAVITATQMLQSMVNNPRPTRAEASDVANAIFDGTDAVMLSGETASGKYPVEAVETMATIAVIAEQHLVENLRITARDVYRKTPMPTVRGFEYISDATSHAASDIADQLDAKAIVTATWTGYTARQAARGRPHTPILCVTPKEEVYHRMALVWGVLPMLVEEFHTVDEMVHNIVKKAHEQGILKYGDLLVMIAGIPFGASSSTNFLKVHKVGEQGEVPER